MKRFFFLIFIMATLSFKLNAYDGSDINDPKLKHAIDLASKEWTINEYKIIREIELRNDRSCLHCPKYLLLTDQINKVVDQIAKDPASSISDELPVKINRLKFLYYTEALHDQNGDIKCQRFMDITPNLQPSKFDGQFKLIAEDVLKFNSVSEIQYMNPNLEEVIYYYRGVEGDKNTVVQAILTKDGGKFRYYRYTPTEKESEPYNLPDLDKNYGGPKKIPTPADAVEVKDIDPNAQPASPVYYKLQFKADLEKTNKYIPKNLHLMDASIDMDIGAGISVKGMSDTSVKGNVAHLAVKNDGKNVVLVDLDTNLEGRSKHRISVPYSIHMIDTLPDYTLKGKIQQENDFHVFTISLTDKSIEHIRSEYRKNSNTNKDSYLLARDIPIGANEVLSVQYGKDEEDKKYASLKHLKSLKNNMTMVLDVRVNEDKTASLYYQLNGKFN